MPDSEGNLSEKVNSMINEFNDRNTEFTEILLKLIDNVKQQIKPGFFKIKGLNWESYEEWGSLLPFLLKALDFQVFTNKFINSCRASYENYLKSLENGEIEDISSKFGIIVSYDREVDLFRVPVFEFTRYCSRISGFDYRLASQSFDRGEVVIKKNGMAKILREYFVIKIREEANGIDADEARNILSPFKEQLDEIMAELEELSKTADLGAVDSSCFPPCVIHFLNDIRGGVNLPHLARFTVVSFLNNIGVSEQGIIESFGTVPDFSKKVTEYQVKHIIGRISGTEYTPPKCVTLRSNHLCYWDDDQLCHEEFMKHPLSYYKIKKKKKIKG